MNKRQKYDMMVIRAKMNAEKATKSFIESWVAEEPEEIKEKKVWPSQVKNTTD